MLKSVKEGAQSVVNVPPPGNLHFSFTSMSRVSRNGRTVKKPFYSQSVFISKCEAHMDRYTHMKCADSD